MIVVDNSVLVSAVVSTGGSSLASGVVSGDERWILPPLWRFEFTNAVATLTKAGVLELMAAHAALDEARALVKDREVPVDQVQALRVAVNLSISGYDAQYIALAQEYGIQCITDDKQLARRTRGVAVLLEDFVT